PSDDEGRIQGHGPYRGGSSAATILAHRACRDVLDSYLRRAFSQLHSGGNSVLERRTSRQLRGFEWNVEWWRWFLFRWWRVFRERQLLGWRWNRWRRWRRGKL